MDPYSSPYIIPNNSPHNPFPHSLLRTRQSKVLYGVVISGVISRVTILITYIKGHKLP